jgi:lambda family phage tail tape measure protein
MAATLYVAIRGNYTEFQRDMARVRGIARESCRELANQFNNAIDPKFFNKGLAALARGLKDINRIASTKGGFLSPAIADLKELAAKAEVSSQTMQMLANRMAEVGRREQLSGALKQIQKFAGLTDAELAKLQKKMGDTAGSMETAMRALGVRSTQQIKRDIAALEAAFDHLAKHGNLSAAELERAFAGLEKKLEPLYAELGVLNKPAGRSASLDVLGMKTDAEYRAEAKKIAQAYLEIKTSADSTAGDVARAHARMIESYRRLREEMTAHVAKEPGVAEAFGALNVRSTADIRGEMQKLQAAFDRVRTSAASTGEDVRRAFASMTQGMRALQAELNGPGYKEKLHGAYHMLGIRSPQEIEEAKQHIIRAYGEIVSAAATTESKMAALAARTDRLKALSQEAGTWQEGARVQPSKYRVQYDKYASQAGAAAGSFGQYEARAKAKEAVDAFQQLHGRLPKHAKEFRDLAAAAGVTAREIWKVRDAMDHTSNAFKALIGYGQVWLTFGFAHTAQDFVKTAMTLENVEVAFKAIYGTSELAQKKLEFVRQVSDELGLSFLDTAEGAKKLFAAAQGTPIEAEANMVFKAFSNMSAAMKLTGDETKGVFLAISQMISKGKVSAEELRQQLAERMPGAVNLFAKSIGVSTQELDKMLQAGGVTLEHFLMFAREVNTHYATGARQASHTLQAEMARIGNTWAKFQKDMTDTGALASIARDFNSVFSGVTGTIVKFHDEIKDLMKAALAGWIASSLVPGGKLNSIIMALGVSFKSTARQMKLFEAFSLSMSAGANRAALAVGKLKIALNALMRHPLVAAVVTTGVAFGLEKLLEPGDDDRFKGEISSSGPSLQEKLRDRLRSSKADKESSFTPEMIRESLLKDIQKEMDTLEKGTVAAGERFKDAIKAAYDEGNSAFSLSDVSEDQYIKMGDARRKAFEQLRAYQQEMNELVKARDNDGMLKLQDRIASGWDDIAKSLKDAGFKDDVINSMHDLFNRLHDIAGIGFDNISKILASFNGNALDAAKELGLEMDKATKKMFDSLEKAAQSNPLGKAAKDMENFNKVAKQLGNFTDGMMYDSVTAKCGEYSDTVVALTNRLAGAHEKHKAYQLTLSATEAAYRLGYKSQKDYERAQEQVASQVQKVNVEHQNLATAIFNASAAAGGSQQAFNVMIAVFEQAARAANMTASQIAVVTAQLRVLMAVSSIVANGKAVENLRNSNDIKELSGLYGHNVSQGNWKEAGQLALKLYAKRNKIPVEEFLGDDKYAGLRGEVLRGVDIEKNLKGLSGKGGKGGRGGKGGGKRVDNTVEKWKSAEEGWRKKIADMQGQKDVQTLAKDFADMDKQLKGSSVDMKALKKDYLEAFNTKYANDLNKELLQLKGNEAELAKIDIEEKYKAKAAAIEGMAEEAKKLGITVQDYAPKLAEYRKLLEGQAREQQLQKELPYYEKFSWWDGNRIEAMEKQNELIAIQAEKMHGTIPDELIERWRELEELQNRVNNGNDVLAGITLGAKKYALEMGNFAQNVSDLVQKSFDDMADAFAEMVITGKANFSDLANSIIKDLMRIAIKQAIIGPIANGLGSLFSAFGFGGGMFGSAKSGIQGAISASSAVASVPAIGLAYGGVLSGLHGFSNQIVNRPTLFSYGSQLTKFAKGGVMGEAGPEAVMPLTRTASGHLGVRSDGGNAPVVNVVINNSTGQAARQQTKTDNEGNKSIEVMIGDMAAQQMMKTGTALNKAARTFSGVSQQVTRR